MAVRRILAKLRHGTALTDAEITEVAQGLADGGVSDAQAAAFAMAICKSGLSRAEAGALALAMRDTGTVLEWDLPGPVIDKHSTGGVGDATTLIVAPVLAALGAYAPVLSGRGLGHTGGTLDKLEAIAGVDTDVSVDRLRRIVSDVGCAVAGASDEIAPADRRLYAIRDATATVDSQPLIVASILSKKLAAGARGLVLDVKGGSGAFMTTRDAATGLARDLVDTARAAGCQARALITDMNQPLAPAIGTAVELAEVIAVLRDPTPDSRLCALSLALVGEGLYLAGVYPSAEAGGRAALEVLHSGAAAEKFGAMVSALGGPADLMVDPAAHLPVAPVRRKVLAARSGRVAAIDGVALGHLVGRLGGARQAPGDPIDARVGLTGIAALGTEVAAGDTIATLHAARDGDANGAVPVVSAAMQIADRAVAPPLIHGRVP